MSQTVINAHIIGQTIQMVNLPLIASGAEGSLVIGCDFSEEWTGYGKTAVFYRDEAEVYHIPMVEGVATIPSEVLSDGGFFYFGIFGDADNTRTTEVLRVTVAKGAITTATATPAEPTPNIYQQILSAYGRLDTAVSVEKARVNELIAMRGSDGAYDDVVADEYFTGAVKHNGINAFITITIEGLSLVAGGHHYSDYFLLPALAPLEAVELKSSNPDLNVTLEAADPNNSGWARLLIENPSTEMYTTDMVTTCSAFYPLNAPYIAELGDLRVGPNGVEYDTAGEMVRAYLSRFIPRLTSITLLASAWEGADGLYSQVVTIGGITDYSKVDLLPSVEQLAIFHNKDVAFITENEDSVVTVYAIGDKPTQDYTMQAQITEVEA